MFLPGSQHGPYTGFMVSVGANLGLHEPQIQPRLGGGRGGGQSQKNEKSKRRILQRWPRAAITQ